MIESAPPTEAPNAARVLRSTLTHGSSRVNIRRLVTAWVRTPRWSSTTPQASPTRAQTRRTGPQRGRGEELVGGGPDAQVDLAERLVRRDAGRLEVAQVLHAGGDGHREGVDVGGAGLVQHPGVDGDGAPAVAVGALAHEVGERGEVGGGAEPGGRAERVEAEVAADRLTVGDQVEQGAGRAGLVGDRRDHDRGEVEAHVGEHLGQVGHGDARRRPRAPTRR